MPEQRQIQVRVIEGSDADKRLRFKALKIVLATPGMQFRSARDILLQAYEIEDYLRFGKQVEPEPAELPSQFEPAKSPLPQVQ